jgi:hypothetical protein
MSVAMKLKRKGLSFTAGDHFGGTFRVLSLAIACWCGLKLVRRRPGELVLVKPSVAHEPARLPSSPQSPGA